MNLPNAKVGLVLLLALAPASAAWCAADAPSPSPSSQPIAGYIVKTRSHFNPPPGTRNPFWPIGWVKPSPLAPGPVQVRQPLLDVSPDLFHVSSIALGDTKIAVINGRLFAEGDPIVVRVGDADARLTVFRIRDGVVLLNFRGREVKVPLRVR